MIMVTGPLLADGFFEGSEAWVLIIIAIASAVGGLLKKRKKAGEAEGEKLGAQRRPPAAPRVPRPPTARPSAPTGRPATLRAEPSVRPREPVRRTQPPVPDWVRLVEPPIAPGPVRRAAPKAPSKPELPREAPAVAVRRLPVRRPPRAQPAAINDLLGRLLRDRAGLQAGIVLSEILATPVGLRERHLL